MSKDNRDVVIFGGDDNREDVVVWSQTASTPNKLKKDPDAKELIEVFVVKDGKLESEWHEMFSRKTTVVIMALLLACFILSAVFANYSQKENWRKYQEAMNDRIFRGCKQVYPWITPEEGDKDEGCRPKGQAP